ncbi:hypothetical protein KA107_02055 [Candidatus Pacearchaeota archaeon]|nr:hypothetical protein [Candidatus Pacearchaeota archaeon]
MERLYSRNEFENDLEGSRGFLDRVVSIGDDLRREIDAGMKKQGLECELLLVGSTNPTRLTTVIDPKTPDDRYTCDFDLAVITPRDFSNEERTHILSKIYPSARIAKHFGREELSFYREKFPVCATIVPESEADQCLPIVYTRKYARFDQDQIHNMRAVRLFCMRNGLYGGYTRGIKGIAIEQLVAKFGSFDKCLEELAGELSRTTPLVLPSPVDKTDLLGRVQPDVLQRLKKASRTFAQTGKIKSSPYTIESWEEDHPNRLNFTLHSPCYDPNDAYNSAKKIFREVESEGMHSALLVIPQYKTSQILASVSAENTLAYESFQRKLRTKWDKRNSCNCDCPGDTKHGI